MEPHPRQETFDRYTRLTDGTLTVLAVLMIPLLLAPVLFNLPEQTADA